MITTVTQMMLKDGAGKAWDAAMQERLDAASKRPGWMVGQVLKPLNGGPRRIVVGTWASRADWEAWHRDPAFQATRSRLDPLEAEPRRQFWHEVTVGAQR